MAKQSCQIVSRSTDPEDLCLIWLIFRLLNIIRN